jgi:hypothetical protein
MNTLCRVNSLTPSPFTDHSQVRFGKVPCRTYGCTQPPSGRPRSSSVPYTFQFPPTVPPWRQPRGKLIVSLANFQTNATRIERHPWEIDLKFSPGLPPGWGEAELTSRTPHHNPLIWKGPHSLLIIQKLTGAARSFFLDHKVTHTSETPSLYAELTSRPMTVGVDFGICFRKSLAVARRSFISVCALFLRLSWLAPLSRFQVLLPTPATACA